MNFYPKFSLICPLRLSLRIVCQGLKGDPRPICGQLLPPLSKVGHATVPSEICYRRYLKIPRGRKRRKFEQVIFHCPASIYLNKAISLLIIVKMLYVDGRSTKSLKTVQRLRDIVLQIHYLIQVASNVQRLQFKTLLSSVIMRSSFSVSS